jgi:succinate-semialdehyde dehydrogenase/glutarate-semialdehyde dehydrogenase
MEYAVINPATGEALGAYPTITPAELEEALANADDAAHGIWPARTTLEQRAALVGRVGTLHGERRGALAELIVTEMGKPITEALEEVDFAADIYKYYAEHAVSLLQDTPITLTSGSGEARVRRSALGVLLGIMPWNYPYYQVARFAGPNLVAGNTVLLKHAPQCPESAAAMQQIFDDVGFPRGAYTNIYATNKQVGDLIADPRVCGVSLTGSERAGTAVAEQAGRHLKKVVLELGGSDPFILLSTDDLEGTAKAAVSARLGNCGQSCNAPKRLIVLNELFDAFVERLTAELLLVRTGDPTQADTSLGPLSSSAAADRLADQVSRAVEQGAELVVGGTRDGNFFAPTLLSGITPENDVHHEELFGPVVCVYRVGSEDEAVHLANDTPFGLGAYVLSTDTDQALRVADKLDSGMVFVNAIGAEAPELPFGGVKRSGFGRELGQLGIEEFVNKKVIRIGT